MITYLRAGEEDLTHAMPDAELPFFFATRTRDRVRDILVYTHVGNLGTSPRVSLGAPLGGHNAKYLLADFVLRQSGTFHFLILIYSIVGILMKERKKVLVEFSYGRSINSDK